MPSAENIADIFTKVMTHSQFLNLRNKLRLCKAPISHLSGDVKIIEPNSVLCKRNNNKALIAYSPICS